MTDVVITDLHKSFPRHPVLRGIDLTVPAGSFTAVLGASGSGKTTLLRIMAGFERADLGTVAIGGQIVDGPGRYIRSEHRRIGYVAQEGSLFPHLTVEANVGFGLRRLGRARRVAQLLGMVGLGGLGRRYPHQLSGGQQQRVALARALAIDPDVVLLDEPFSSLDAGLRASVRNDVRDVLHEAGTTAVLVTHDQDEALSLADLVAVIRHGRIAQVGTPAALYGQPADPELARFFGDINLVGGVVAHGSASTTFGLLPLAGGADRDLPDGQRVTVMVRPEQIEVSDDPSNWPISGYVESIEYYGHDAVLKVRPVGHDGRSDGDALVVRVIGGDVWRPSQQVGLRVRGAVTAWQEQNTPA
jgi:iron(III) transport system ATP-binding protein